MTSKIKLPNGQIASDGDFIIVFHEDERNGDEYIEEIFTVDLNGENQGGAINSVWIDEEEEKIRKLMYDDKISMVKDILSLEESGTGSIWVRDDIGIIEERLEEEYGTDEYDFSTTGRIKVALQKIKHLLT